MRTRDSPDVQRDRPLHQRFASATLPVLRIVWDPLRRFYHRARYPPYKPLELRSRRRCSQSQSRLLMLPAEIRFVIWDYVMVSSPIALYRARDRITYDLLLEESLQSVTEITPHTIQKAVEGRTDLKATKMHKPSLLSVLQTCQMIYSETLHLLYQANTFVTLHNTTSLDFCNSALPAHLSLITSLHIHFQFREIHFRLLRGEPDPYNKKTFSLVCTQVCRYMPNLRTLSIFLQGPIMHDNRYGDLAKCLCDMRDGLKKLHFMTVRFPHLAPVEDRIAAALGPQSLELWQTSTDRWMASMRHYFHVFQPPVANGQQAAEVADLDTGTEEGWRVGSMYMPGSNGSEGIDTRNYVFFTGAEEQVATKGELIQ